MAVLLAAEAAAGVDAAEAAAGWLDWPPQAASAKAAQAESKI